MRTVAIIVSAGKGARFKGKIPKQYVKINDKPLICYTLTVFNSSPYIDNIILVAENSKIEYCRKLVKRYNLKKITNIVKGGNNRALSVYNGLKIVPKDTEVVIVHDGVRPVVKQGIIKNIIKTAKKYGAAITGVTPKDTIKELSETGCVKKTHPRNRLISVQTPQAFRFNILKNSYEKFKNRLNDVTDDSSLVEMAGYKVRVIEGDYQNIKITTNEDMDYVRGGASHIMGMGYDCSRRRLEHLAHRVGMGYDIHRLVKNRRLVLGGVEIPSKHGLLGHSDADVLLHAITDAILGAIGERDIGWHFPNTDKKYSGIASSVFLLKAKEMLKRKKYKICNIDSIIVAQEPKLQPYYIDMVKNMCNWLDMRKKNITVKFTTPEKMGPLGHKKAIASIAVVAISI